jgi:hypothetical protein
VRALLLCTLLVTACRFDTSGKAIGGDDDDAVVDASTTGTIDGGPHVTPDATSLPETIDAGATNPPVACGNETCGGTTICCATWQGSSCTAPDACSGSTQACDGPEDCPGQLCCEYAGSWTSCQDSCLGGDTVCTSGDDCGGDECCGHSGGPSTCGLFCF